MSAYSILQEYAASAGWDTDLMLAIVCEYVDLQMCEDVFEEFVATRAAEEAELSSEAH